jgi:hypothetical protein
MKDRTTKSGKRQYGGREEINEFVTVFPLDHLDPQDAQRQQQQQQQQQQMHAVGSPFFYLPGQYWQSCPDSNMTMNVYTDFSNVGTLASQLLIIVNACQHF